MADLRQRKAKSMIFVEDSEAHGGLELARRAVSKIDGLFDVEANHVSHLLIFEYDQDKITLEQIQRIAKKARQRGDESP